MFKIKKNTCSIVNFWVLLLILLLSLRIIYGDSCCDLRLKKKKPVYQLIKKNSRSEEVVLSRRQLSSVELCREFAVTKQALAFNFRSFRNSTIIEEERKKKNKHDDTFLFNCHALACPEKNSFTSLVDDKHYDYYSIYKKKLMPVNESVTCVPSIGLFVFYKTPDNYTNAEFICNKIQGKLAHVGSFERSEGLGKFIFNNSIFVGLSNRGKERGWKNSFGESLSCFNYRGWALGEPSNSRGCVALSREVIHGNYHSFWRVVPCSQSLPFVCEILPKSPKKKKKKKKKT